MASKSPNLKVNVTADTSDLNRKLKDSKTAVRDFESTTSDAVDAIGSMFGVNTDAVKKMSSAINGLGIKMQEVGGSGSAAFGKMLSGISGLAAGIAGLGIASVVSSFKLLNAEATAFKNTVQGANIEMQTAAYIDTYRQVIHDFNQEIGEGTAEAQSSWEKFWGTLGSGMRAAFSTGAIAPSAPGDFNNTANVNFGNLLGEAGDKARTAAEISQEMYEVTRKLSDQSVVWAEQEAKIAENKRIAYDKTVDLATQQQALSEAVRLINERYTEEAELRQRMAELQAEMNALASSSVEQVDLENQLKVQAFQTTVAMDNALRELGERQAALTLEAQKEADARAKSLATAQAIANSRASLAAWSTQAGSPSVMTTEATTQTKPEGLPSTATVDIEVGEVDSESASAAAQLIASEMQVALGNVGVSMGNLITDLINGGDAWGNFANAAIVSLADMAIAVGQMAIKIGVASLGITAALESLNGAVAIAAGVALVAIGTAVKSGMTNISSGNYSASAATGVVSSYSSHNSLADEFSARELAIRVTGTLVGSGSTLKAVLDNEASRVNQTT